MVNYRHRHRRQQHGRHESIDVIIIIVVFVVSVIVRVVIGIVVIIVSAMDVYRCPCGPGSSALAFPRVVARDGGRALCRGCSKSVGSLLEY